MPSPELRRPVPRRGPSPLQTRSSSPRALSTSPQGKAISLKPSIPHHLLRPEGGLAPQDFRGDARAPVWFWPRWFGDKFPGPGDGGRVLATLARPWPLPAKRPGAPEAPRLAGTRPGGPSRPGPRGALRLGRPPSSRAGSSPAAPALASRGAWARVPRRRRRLHSPLSPGGGSSAPSSPLPAAAADPLGSASALSSRPDPLGLAPSAGPGARRPHLTRKQLSGPTPPRDPGSVYVLCVSGRGQRR